MKIVKMECPNCGANLDFERGKQIMFCPYCGVKLYIDDGVKRSEQTININQNITRTNRRITRDETRIEKERERTRQKEEEAKGDKYAAIGGIAIMAFFIVMLLMLHFGF